MGFKIGTPALLAGFDKENHARVGSAALLEFFDSENCGESGVAVVSDTSGIHTVTATDGLVRIETFRPFAQGGLFVHVPVEHHGTEALLGGGYVED